MRKEALNFKSYAPCTLVMQLQNKNVYSCRDRDGITLARVHTCTVVLYLQEVAS